MALARLKQIFVLTEEEKKYMLVVLTTRNVKK